MVATVTAMVSLVIASILAVINIIKFFRERRRELEAERALRTTSSAERDRISVAAAEKTLEMMERVLALSRENESDLRKRVAQLEEREREYINRIRVLEDEVRMLRKQLSPIDQGE